MDRREYNMDEFSALLANIYEKSMAPTSPGPVATDSPEILKKRAEHEQMLSFLGNQEQARAASYLEGGPVQVQSQAAPVATATPIEQMQQRVAAPVVATKLPNNPKVKQPTEKAKPVQEQTQEPVPSPEVAQKIAEEEAVAQNPETAMAVADQKIEQIKQETATTPEEKQKLDNAVAGMSLPQKLAMIAMAVAPTAVGFALAGKKGAYLGASATGKGLQEGAKAYSDEEDAARKERKLDIEQMRAEKVAAAKSAASKNKQLRPNKYGQMGFVDTDGVWNPVTDQTGEPVFESNEPRPAYNSATQQMELVRRYEKMPGQQQPDQAPQSQPQTQQRQSWMPQGYAPDAPKSGRTVNEFLRGNNEEWLRLGAKNPASGTDKYKSVAEIDIESDTPPKGMSKDRFESIKSDVRAFLVKEKANQDAYKKTKQYQDFVSSENDKRRQQQEKMAAASRDKAGDARFGRMLSDKVKQEYIPYKEHADRVALYLNKFSSHEKGVKDGVLDPMIWQSYLKEIQQDQSVIRPGESEMALMFMPVSQKWASALNRYGKLDSIMTAELRKDIINLFAESKRIKQFLVAERFNSQLAEARRQGREAIFYQSVDDGAVQAARDFSREKIKKAISPTPKEFASLRESGKIKNGDFILVGGKPMLFRDQQYDPNTGAIVKKGTLVPWGFAP